MVLACPGYAHPAALPEQALLKACEVKHTKGSGPGGQHRNKTQTAIVITHQPTGLQGAASERRSQHENLRVAIRRLRLNLAVEHRAAIRLQMMLPESSQAQPDDIACRWFARVRHRKLALSDRHEDYPALLAWVMDILWEKQLVVGDVAVLLGVSASQLVKMLKSHGPAIVCFNQARSARNLPPMK